jgi:hypothetical protein
LTFIILAFVFAAVIIWQKESLPERTRRPLALFAIGLVTCAIITAMKSATSGSLLELKSYCQKAIVCFTIAKVYDEGIFHLDASGIKLKFDVLPWEKVQAVDYGKQVEQMNKAVKKQIENGTQYILLAKDVITENPSDFTSFTKIYKKDAPIKYEAHKTSGIVGIV